MKQETIEDYLKAMYLLQQEKDVVHAKDIANYMQYSKASVSVALHKLEALGYLFIDDKANILLSKEGQKVAYEVHERYVWLSQLLIKAGVNKEIACKEGHKVEHDISTATFLKLKQFLCNQ